MAKSRSNHPLDLIHHRLWADDLQDIVRELQRSRLRPVNERDVLDFLFSKHRDDPETKELVRQIRRSLARALELNRRILSLRDKHASQLEEALYTEDDEDSQLIEEALLEKRLFTAH
jgi:hypothetical protein